MLENGVGCVRLIILLVSSFPSCLMQSCSENTRVPVLDQ
jgi:hypothetical protein